MLMFLAKLHLLLTPDVAHKAVFTNVPMIGFKNDRSIKGHLVLVVLPKVDAEGRSKPCVCVCGRGWGRGWKKRSCELCKSGNATPHFKRRDTDETFNILKGSLDCSSNHLICLFECKQCEHRFPYVRRTKTKFKYRINNYK